MGSKVLFICSAILVGALLAAHATAAEAPALKTDKEKQGYAVGVDLARNLKRQGVVAEADALARGLQDELSGASLLMNEDDLQASLNAFQAEVKQRRARPVNDLAIDNRKKGEAFLSENKTKEGVVTLPSGLQYKVLKEGSGRKPTESDIIAVNYRGSLIDGTVFDNSYGRPQPASLKLSGVIPGWGEALKLMPVGSKWQLFVPSDLAYGEQGVRRKIGPNETLIFEIDLIAIK